MSSRRGSSSLLTSSFVWIIIVECENAGKKYIEKLLVRGFVQAKAARASRPIQTPPNKRQRKCSMIQSVAPHDLPLSTSTLLIYIFLPGCHDAPPPNPPAAPSRANGVNVIHTPPNNSFKPRRRHHLPLDQAITGRLCWQTFLRELVRPRYAQIHTKTLLGSRISPRS